MKLTPLFAMVKYITRLGGVSGPASLRGGRGRRPAHQLRDRAGNQIKLVIHRLQLRPLQCQSRSLIPAFQPLLDAGLQLADLPFQERAVDLGLDRLSMHPENVRNTGPEHVSSEI